MMRQESKFGVNRIHGLGTFTSWWRLKKSLEITRIIRVHSLGNVCTEQLLNYFCQSRSSRYVLAIGIYD